MTDIGRTDRQTDGRRKRERKERNREKNREKERKREKREKRIEKDVQGQLLSICIQFSKRKPKILAEMLEISKSWCGSLVAHYHYKSFCRS